MQSTTWQLYFGSVRFSFSFSWDSWRGFSGEGAALEDIPQSWVDLVDKYSYADQTFNPALFSVEYGIDMQKLSGITSRLSAMGLLGYDVDDNSFFYRQLPYKLQRIMSPNPRLKNAEKRLEENNAENTLSTVVAMLKRLLTVV